MRYLHGDKVSYTGEKFKGEIGGSMGEVEAPVIGNPHAFVVSFGGRDAYVMHENVLTTFQGHLKPAGEAKEEGKKSDKKDAKKPAGPTVEMRRGGRSRKGEEE